MRLKDVDTGREYTGQIVNGALTVTLTPVLNPFTQRVKDWATRLGYPHAERKVRLISRLPRSGKYDSYETLAIEEIHEKFPNRKIVGGFDAYGVYHAAPQS